MKVQNVALDACWAKIERAAEHIGHLDSELSAFVRANQHLCRLTTSFDPAALRCVVTAIDDGIPTPPRRLSIIAGEALHQMRSTLDHAVWAHVASRHGGHPPYPRIAFPICATEKVFRDACRNRKLQGASARFTSAVESMQPFNSQAQTEHPLAVLELLDNTYKHRLLMVTCVSITNPRWFWHKPEDVKLTVLANPFRRPLRITKEGTELFSFTLSRFGPDVEVGGEPSCDVAIESPGSAELKLIVPFLRELHSFSRAALNNLAIHA